MNIRTKEIVALKEIRHTVQDKGVLNKLIIDKCSCFTRDRDT